ncbi:MAG: L-idonate 5-dehydrogenase [Mycobacteriales bacterium]
MRSMAYVAPQDLRMEERPPPELGPRDALLRVEACGICGSDVASYLHGHYAEPGQVLGHELSALVEMLGADLAGSLHVGGRVAVRSSRSCGKCHYCGAGRPYLCDESRGMSVGYGVPGGFADFMVMRDVEPGRDLVPVPDDLPADELIWAEPLAVAVHAVRRAELADVSGPTLLVGAGSVGLCVLAAARAGGARDLTIVEPRPDRLAAAARIGARGLTPDELAGSNNTFDVVIDTSGSAAALQVPVGRLRPGGRLVLVGLGDQEVPWPLPAADLVTSFAWDDDDFATAVRYLVSREVRLAQYVTHRYPLSETGAAIAASAGNPTVVKAVVYPGRTKLGGPQAELMPPREHGTAI